MKVNDKNHLQDDLAQMDIIQLEKLLQRELEKDSNADPETVKMLLRTIDEREEAYSFVDDVNVQAACDKYRAHQNEQKVHKQKNLRVAAAALAAAILLVIIPQTVRAENLWDIFARWTESIFALFNPSGSVIEEPEYVFQTDNPGLQQIYDAVTELGVTEPVVPMWVPDGYELTECETYHMPAESYVNSRLAYGESKLIFNIVYYAGCSVPEYHKDESEVEEWEYNGVIHYIMRNKDYLVAVWLRENVECALSVDCQEDVLYEILKSIYLTEDE